MMYVFETEGVTNIRCIFAVRLMMRKCMTHTFEIEGAKNVTRIFIVRFLIR